MSVHIFEGRFGATGKGDPAYCRQSVHEGGRGVGFYQCCRKPTVFRCIDGKEYGFCGQHDPEDVQRRRAKRDAKWAADYAARQAKWARADQEKAALAACKDAIAKIAAGHNDPRTLATEVLALFPEAPS